jgi:putative spermidine/putrescine transport system substrate-binding protein
LTRRAFVVGSFASLGGIVGLASCRDDNDAPTATTTVEIPSPTPVLTVAGYDDPTRWAGREIVVATAAGEYEDAQRLTIFEPFERLTGAAVSVEALDLENLRGQVEAGDVTWSLCDVSTDDVLPLANAALIQAIDYSIVDGTDLYPATRMPQGVGASLFSVVMALRTDIFPSAPTDWQDFWDLDRFPGNRGLQRSPVGTLEFALLAAGVPISELYPIDVDRAFEMLDLIKPFVFLWWEQGAQPVQMIASNDAVMASAWHNRVERLSVDGAPITFSWNGTAVDADSWVVPSGSPETEMAMDLINFATRPEVCAAFASRFPFGPTNQRAYEFLPPEALGSLPGAPALAGVQFTLDFEWWFQNGEETTLRFEEWLSLEIPVEEEE